MGAKRNWLNSRASGEWIAHWDDDDWSELDRLEKQIRAAKTDVVGCRNAIFWDETTSQAWLYTGTEKYAIGSSLMYRRSYWHERQFEGLNVGEDNAFVAKARARGHLTALDDLLVVATTHCGNTSRRQYHSKQWQKAEKAAIPADYFL